MKKSGLGRGLDALLGDSAAAGRREELRHIPLDLLSPGKYQPRTQMDPVALEDLAASIRAQGVMQPVVARPVGPDRFEIVAGERRWRAARIAGLERIPALVRSIPDEQAMALALIENIQREDLNPIEEAQALNRLHTEFGLTHQHLAEQVGRSRASVTNMLRLLRLPAGIRAGLENGQLSMGHARSLLTLSQALQLKIAQRVMARGLSVRDTERLVQRLQGDTQARQPASVDPNLRKLEEAMANALGARVRISQRGRKGRISIEYHSLDELDGVLARLRIEV